MAEMKKAITIVIAVVAALFLVTWGLGSLYESYFSACAVWFIPVAKAMAFVTGIFASVIAGTLTYAFMTPDHDYY